MSLTSYERVISDSLCNELLEYFNSIKHNLTYISASSKFPPRKHYRNIPECLVKKIKQNVHDNIGKKYKNMAVKDNMRIYLSNFGTVKPHVDVSLYGDDTHTCLIYLTDDFTGGCLTVEDENQKKYTFSPKKSYGVTFPKGVVHYTDELIDGEKIILLVDIKT